MDESKIVEKLRVIFLDIVMGEEDSEFDDPEYLTGEIIDFLKYRDPSDETFLHLAALRGELEGAKLLVDLGIDMNIIGDMGNTALHYAARHGHPEVYDYLLAQGADDNIVNEFGKTPRQYREELSQKKKT